MIALDLDGTLFNNAKKITERTRLALERAAASGIHIVISTGRPVTAIPKEVMGEPYIRYLITTDGARIEDKITGQLLFDKKIPRELVRPIYDIFDEYDVIEEIYIDGQGYVSAGDVEIADQYVASPAHVEYMRKTRAIVEDIHDLMDQDIDKAHALFKTVEDREEVIRRLNELAPLVLCDAFMINLEVSAEGVDKGEGLRILGDKIGISTEEIMAFGDSNNDASMLRTAGLSVCMENGEEALKRKADIVAPANEEDGVVAVIEQFLEERSRQ